MASIVDVVVPGDTVGWIHVLFNNECVHSCHTRVARKTPAGDIIVTTWIKKYMDDTFELVDDLGAIVPYECEETNCEMNNGFYMIVAHSKVPMPWTDGVCVLDCREAPNDATTVHFGRMWCGVALRCGIEYFVNVWRSVEQGAAPQI